MDFSSRTALLLGAEAMQQLASRRVLVVGVGGVGSWCAESLVRSGVEHLTIADGDVVVESNINRQVMATHKTIGLPKVDVLRKRLLEINQHADIVAVRDYFSEETVADFHLDDYHYIIDCIDSLSAKMSLLLLASSTSARVFSSMGAALKMDPLRIRVAEMWRVRGCPLGAALRKKMKRSHRLPKKDITCVYSEELLSNHGGTTLEDGNRTNGTLVHVTASFGFTLASLVIKDITNTLCEKKYCKSV